MGLTPGDDADLNDLVSISSHTNFRGVEDLGRHMSDWVNLTAGESYYLEGRHYEGSGGDHFTASVEIEQAEIENHPNSVREVQQIEMYPVHVMEQSYVEMTNTDTGSYVIAFLHPVYFNYTMSGILTVDCSTDTFKDAIKDYFKHYFDVGIYVSKTYYNKLGGE
jgi:hypothetical protein